MSEVEFNKFAICDTCGSETLCREDGEDDQCGGCYWAPINHAKHQSELAALREELAAARAECERHKNVRALAVKDAAKVCQRLTAAEQRNAELVELLRETDRIIHRHQSEQAMSISVGRRLQEARHKINSALTKPTESGASE